MTEHGKKLLVELRLDAQMILIESPPEELLRALRTTCLVTGPDQHHGYQVRGQRQPLYETFGGERGAPLVLKVWAGLCPVVRRLLKKKNYTARIIKTAEEDSTSVLPEPDLASLQKVAADLPFLNFLRTKGRGHVIIDQSFVSPASLIVQAARAFPEAKITVAVSRISDGYNLRDAIRKHEPDVHFFYGKNYPWKSPRVAIATYRYLHHSTINLFERDIVFALDAREAVCPEGREQLALAQKARLFGLVSRGRQISPHERDLMRIVFGFDELVLPRHGHRERGVQVVRCPFVDGPGLPPGADDYTLQKEGVWTNGPRNNTIAMLARQVKERDVAQLLGLAPAVLPASGHMAPRVVVLVEQLRHGLALAELLPGWPLLADRSGVNARGLTTAQIDMLEAGKQTCDSQPPHAIVTRNGMEALDLKDIDVVIRADAGDDLPALPAHKLIEPDSQPERPLLLIDLNDQHPLLRNRTRERRRAYEARGWFAPGVDPVQRRVELFLAGRKR